MSLDLSLPARSCRQEDWPTDYRDLWDRALAHADFLDENLLHDTPAELE